MIKQSEGGLDGWIEEGKKDGKNLKVGRMEGRIE